MPQAIDEAGNVWETDAQGNPVRLISQAGGGQVFSLPQDPNTIADNNRADAGLALQQQNAARQAAAQAAQIEIARMNANKPPPGYRYTAGGNMEVIPGGPADPKTLTAASRPTISAKERADAIAAYFDADAIDRTIASLRQQYEQGPGSTKGVYGLRDYLPTSTNRTFDDIGNQARGAVKRTKGFTGGEGNTIAESEALYGPYLPKASDYDAQILNKIKALEELGNDARTRSIAILGGVPDKNGQITPVQQFAGYGATQTIDPIPPEMQAELDRFVGANGAGNLDPVEYAAFRAQLDEKYGFGAVTPEKLLEYRNEAGLRNQTQDRGVNPNIPGAPRNMSTIEQLRNNAVSSPIGSGVTGFADAMGFGAVSALQPDAMASLQDMNPNSMALGQIAGTIGATGALGKAGASTIGRVAPRLMGGAGKAQFARNLATDAAYSGIYGGMTQGDPLTGAAIGAAGSAGGQAIGKGLGVIAGGVRASPAVQALRSRGIPLTLGQALGGKLKAAEDAASSIPLVGDVINARRMEGLQAFNRAAMNDAGAPVGASVNRVGLEGANDLRQQISDAYERATRGARVPLDRQFNTDLQAVALASRNLPPDYADRFAKAMDNRVGPIATAGEMTGDAYQQAVRGIKGYRKQASQAAPGFEQDYKDALSKAQDALTAQMKRGGGQQVVEGLAKADEAYRNLKTLEDAMGRNAGGTTTGETFTFTPSQLQRAGMKTQGKFPGARPFADLADNAQGILPSQIPDSGTARRVMNGVLGGGAALGAGTGVGYATGDPQEGAIASAVLASLLMAGGSRPVQGAAVKGLLDRTDELRRIGAAIDKKRGMFGSASIPLFLGGY